jgi:nucleoid DNA-binding protein
MKNTKKRPELPQLPRLLLADVAKDLDLAQNLVKEVVETALAHIAARARIGPVKVRGFGTFYTARRAGYVRASMEDPKQQMTIPTTERLALRSAPRRPGEEK